MRPRTWWGLLRRNHFRVSPTKIPIAISVSLATPINTVLGVLERLVFGGKIARTELQGAPIFIIGHWRSGTTLLHELLVRDERFSSPSTFQCFAPHHFLLTEWFFRTFLSWLLPGKRPMDNMAAGWDRPQEDEFALMNLGQPSPYRRIAFHREPPPDMAYLSLTDVDDAARHEWIETLRRFLIRVSMVTQRPLVIKSPTHTGRISILARQFPNAKFIHLTRDPRALFPSTCRLWKSLDSAQSLQSSADASVDDEAIKQYVLDCFEHMYQAFDSARDDIPEHRLLELRYEDLIADPVQSLKRVYDELRLADFDSVQQDIEKWAATEHRDYQTNHHNLDEATEATLLKRWSNYFQRYEY